MKKIKVLLVDDNETILNSLKKIIESLETAEVIAITNNCQEEEKLIIELKPDIVFTDYEINGYTAFDVSKNINEKMGSDKPQFVVLTGLYNIELIEEGKKYEIVDFIRKPFSDKDIIEKIEEY